MKKAKPVDAKYLAELNGIVFAFVGLITGLFYGIGGFFYDLNQDALSVGTVYALFAILIMPALFAIGGYLFGFIEAKTYNFVIKKVLK